MPASQECPAAGMAGQEAAFPRIAGCFVDWGRGFRHTPRD